MKKGPSKAQLQRENKAIMSLVSECFRFPYEEAQALSRHISTQVKYKVISLEEILGYVRAFNELNYALSKTLKMWRETEGKVVRDGFLNRYSIRRSNISIDFSFYDCECRTCKDILK